jgi:prepilin-type processing-associated H-X9-DG protein
LVVIAIIGILIGLLLPAINASREAARRIQCESNLKQLALATLSYTEARRSFPPSCTWVNDDPSNVGGVRDNWVIMILPFMEYNSLYNQFQHDKPISDPVNLPARATSVREMLCPSDTFNRKPFNGSSGSKTVSLGDNWARGNYGANGALGYLSKWYQPYPSGGAATTGWRDVRIRGIMGSGCALTPTQITDGLSRTILLAELRAGIASYDPRGVWAMSGACPSSIWGTAYFVTDDYGPNCLESDADDIVSCSQLRTELGGVNAAIATGMPCSGSDSPDWQQTSRSLHSGGVYAAFADGSVHWISNTIDCTNSTVTNPSVWERLMASGDGKIIPSDAF